MSTNALEGRRIVVTGAGMGLGAAYADAAAAAGASVLVNDLRPEPAAETAERIITAGGKAVPFAADVSNWDAAKQIIDRCVTEFGGIDGLVNNAGIVTFTKMLDETEENIRRIIDVNTFGTIFVGVHAARAMVEGGSGGAIVNVTSGNQCGHVYVTTYGASKGAVASLTYAWARELAEHNIRVNAISPNAHTHQIDQMLEQFGRNLEHAELPPKEHNAALMTFLLSDASEKLSGQVVRIDSEGINVMGHPVVVHPQAQLDEWSVDAISGAFANGLGDHLQPLGIAEADVRIVRELL